MANMLTTGRAWLREQRKAHMTTTVTYTRGSDSVELLATPAITSQPREDANGFPIRVESAEFILDVADLILGGVAVLPRVGDTITHAGAAYDVLPEPGLDCWRYCDSDRATIRVHAKQVSV